MISAISTVFGGCFGASPDKTTRSRAVPCLRQRSRRIPIDQTPEGDTEPPPRPATPLARCFRVASVRRVHKIEDYDYDLYSRHAPPWIPPIIVEGPTGYEALSPLSTPTSDSTVATPSTDSGRNLSTESPKAASPYSILPVGGAKVHSKNWASKDFEQWQRYEAERESFELGEMPKVRHDVMTEQNSQSSTSVHTMRRLPWDCRTAGMGLENPPPPSWYQQAIPRPIIAPRSSFRRSKGGRHQNVVSDPFGTPSTSQREALPPASPRTTSSEQYKDYGRACLWPRPDVRYVSSSTTATEADGSSQPRTDVFYDAQED